MHILYQRVLAIFIGIFIFFVIGEVGYRAYVYTFKPLYRPSSVPGLLWEPTPGADVIEDGIRYKINSNGLRDYEYPIEKPKDTFRVAIIGDSVTWGYTELRDTYPKVIEVELKRLYPKKRFEVLNFGIEGTGTLNHIAVLRERVLQYDPDLVILGYCLNDLLNDKRFAYIGPVTRWFLQHSYFADFVAIKSVTFARVLRERTGVMNEERYYRDSIRLYGDDERISALRSIFREMNNLLKERKKNFMVVVFPFRQQFNNAAHPIPQKKLSGICRAEGILFFDPMSELRGYNVNELYVKGDPVHFSPNGNEVVARSILNFLQSQGLLAYRRN